MLAVVALASSAFAQGTVTFASGSNLVRQQTLPNDPASVPVAVNGGFVQLYWAASGAADPTAWTPATSPSAWLAANTAWAAVPDSIKAINGPVAGRFNGGIVTVPTSAPGASVKAFVMGWGGNYASADAAYTASGFVGVSATFAVAPGNPTTTPAGLPGSTIGAFQGMTLVPISAIPEPSTLTLAGLGIAALLAIRRRK